MVQPGRSASARGRRPAAEDAGKAATGQVQSLNRALSLLTAVLGPAAVLVITFLAALYPALKIRRLRPLEAINYV